MPEQIILASSSPFRKSLLANAGIEFVSVKPEIDERAVEVPLRDSCATPEDGPDIGDAGRVDVRAYQARCRPHHSACDEIFHKPVDMDARTRSARPGAHNERAVALVRDGHAWSHVAIARLTMRRLDPPFVGRYLAGVGASALASVGAYQIEGQGIQLFEKIDGDYFTIVGLPLLPLLAALRDRAAIDG